MSRVDKGCGHTVANINYVAVVTGAEQFYCILNVLGGIKRLVHIVSGALGFTVAPLGLKLLDMRRVHKHYIAQLCARFCKIYFAAKAGFVKKRNFARMVNMRMGKQKGIYVARRTRQIAIFIDILALLHAAVDKNFFAAGFKQGARAGHFMSSAQKT